MRLLLLCISTWAALISAQSSTIPNQFYALADPANVGDQGKMTDPSNRVIGYGVADPSPTFDAAGANFYLPSQRSGQLDAAVAGGNKQLRFTGRKLSNVNGVTPLWLGLARQNQPCSAGVDTAFGMVRLDNPSPNGDSMTFNAATGNCVTGGGANAKCWNDVVLELESSLNLNGYGRKLCVSDTAGTGSLKWTGLYLRTAWDCDEAGGLAAKQCNAFNTNNIAYDVLTPLERSALSSTVRTTCCKSSVGLKVGVCVNPRAEKCCGGSPYTAGGKCCSSTNEFVAYDYSACPCRAENQIYDPNNSTRVINRDCAEPEGNATTTSTDMCCLPTKYNEFMAADDNNPATPPRPQSGIFGSCYKEWGHNRCCNTGQVYDPGSQQCCSMNGLQSVNQPCLCASDMDCEGGQMQWKFMTHKCCRASGPDAVAPWQMEMCTSYANFPQTGSSTFNPPGQFGSGAGNAQRCFGQCLDSNFQICCNGVACVREFEKCCNTTCCNKFSGSCEEGIRSGSKGSQFNWNDFRVQYTQCTTIEHLNPIKTFLIFILPTCLMILTLGSLAVVLVFANKASNRSYSFVETAMIVLAVLIIAVSVPVFFSPAWKYALLAVVAALIAILSASARVKRLNVLALVIILLVILYFVDPFPSNAYLNFGSYRNFDDGWPNPDTQGVFHTIGNLWRDWKGFCVEYYDYFMLDDNLRDMDRFDNPEKHTFGYCARSWIAALLIFAAILLMLLFILFFVALLALVLRFRKAPELAPIELEVQKLDDYVDVADAVW